MGSITYAYAGQQIFDVHGDYIATLGRDLTGRGVRWSPDDFLSPDGVKLTDKNYSSKLTAALWKLHKANQYNDVETDWIA